MPSMSISKRIKSPISSPSPDKPVAGSVGPGVMKLNEFQRQVLEKYESLEDALIVSSVWVHGAMDASGHQVRDAFVSAFSRFKQLFASLSMDKTTLTIPMPRLETIMKLWDDNAVVICVENGLGTKTQSSTSDKVMTSSRTSFILDNCLDFIDPHQGRLLRLNICSSVDEGIHLVHLAIHRCVADEIFSLEVLSSFVNALASSSPPLQQTQIQAMKLSSKLSKDEMVYWSRALEDGAPILQVPTDFSPSSKASLSRQRVWHEITRQCRGDGDDHLSWSGKVLAALCLVLHRRSGEADLRILSSTNSASASASPMPPSLLRIQMSKSHEFSFLELGKKATAALRHVGNQVLRIEDILSICGISASSSEILNSLEVAFESLELPQLPPNCQLVSPSFLPSPQSTAQLHFRLWKIGDAFHLSCDFNHAVYAVKGMEEMLRQVVYALDQANSDVNSSLNAFSLVTSSARTLLPDPRRRLDEDWPGAITKRFDELALNQCADSPAIISDDEVISYGTLKQVSDRLAIAILESGLGRGDVIAIYGHRSAWLVCAIVGILKSGAAYCMMDPKYPDERIICLLSVAKPKGWIAMKAAGVIGGTVRDQISAFPFLLEVPARLDRNWQPPLRSDIPGPNGTNISETVSLPIIEKDDIAVVTFTSGSTGIPKGVCGRHVSLTHFYPWMIEHFGLSPSDRFSMCSGIAHDPLQRDIFTPLFIGCPILIPSVTTLTEPGALAQWMDMNAVTVSCLTPAMGQVLTCCFENSDDVEKSFGKAGLVNLRYAFFVGDCLIKRDVNRLMRLAPNVTCVNMYGSTETQRAVGYLNVESQEDLKAMKEVVPVGVGMKDVDLVLLNASGSLAGICERAEIYVRSPHLSAGYLGRPEETSKRFIVNPFTGIDSDRMYRTGDLGRYNVNGLVECNGRVDDQVTIRGFRVELGEVNALLSKHEFVSNDVTVLGPQNHHLISYVVLSSLGTCSKDSQSVQDVVETLRHHLQASLPSYMVPAHIIVLETMPLTPNGKIDRKALPGPMEAGPSSKAADSAPSNHTEAVLVDLWKSALDLISIRVVDDFFDMGGHSLIATMLSLQMSKEFGVHVPVSLLFENSTIRTLAAAISTLEMQQNHAHLMAVKLQHDVDIAGPFGSGFDPEVLPFDQSRHLQILLLTGATGFVGTFLLASLLQEDPKVHIVCCVRAPDHEAALHRVRQSLHNHNAWNESFEGRFSAFSTDLSLPNLGWDAETWSHLSQSIDAIIHSGALVHWLTPYEGLKAVNVDGTIALLQLASQYRLKPFHHLSTTSVLNGDETKSMDIVDESFHPSCAGLTDGYGQSKWVAEHIVLKARHEYGVPASIYRPAFIAGHSKTGVSNTDDFICRLIKGCIQMKASPILDKTNCTIDVCPVDYVVDAIAHCVLRGTSLDRTVNIVNPKGAFAYDSFFESVKTFGYPLVSLPYQAWRQRLVDIAEHNAFNQRDLDSSEADDTNALLPLLAHFSTEWDAQVAQRPAYSRSNAADALAGSCLEVSCDLDTILPFYISYLVNCGFIQEKPGEAASSRNHDNCGELERVGSWTEKNFVKMLSRTNRSV